jgi:hypothetical protein
VSGWVRIHYVDASLPGARMLNVLNTELAFMKPARPKDSSRVARVGPAVGAACPGLLRSGWAAFKLAKVNSHRR